jgi:arginine decarboxylase
MEPLSPVLLISGDAAGHPASDSGHAQADAAMQHIGGALERLGYRIERTGSTDEGLLRIESQPLYAAVVLDWDLADGKRCSSNAAVAIIRRIRERSRVLPIFLATETTSPGALPLPVAREVHGYLHPLSETAETTAHRLDFAVRQYYAGLLPPYLRALKQRIDEGLDVWDGAGRQGADTYRRHPVGAEFQRLFGEGLTRADLGGRVPELGNWLEHVGALAESERRAARVFGADRTYFVVGGASAGNRMVITGVVARDDIVLTDRSSHASLMHAFTLAGARPVPLRPTTNGYGMIGPIPLWSFAAGHIKELLAHNPLARGTASAEPVLAVLTNSTHDGLCCNVERVAATVGSVVPRLLVDEAAFGYAHVHPMYAGRHAMAVRDDGAERPTLFAVQSTHRILPALSMSSMVHIKASERAPVDSGVFNQSVMMHSTTSPFAPIVASNDVATAMMEQPAGRTLLDEAIRDAIGFRQAVAATRARLDGGGDDAWFFGVFQPDHVTHPDDNVCYAFAEAPPDLLAAEPSCWTLAPGQRWHGFADIEVEGDFTLVDPMKVTLICPGIDSSGTLGQRGMPACVLARFLDERRISIARTGQYTVLVPFSVGAGHGRWGVLLEALHEFKRFYDGAVTVGEALPKLVAAHPRYSNLTLRTLCNTLHTAMLALEISSLRRDATSLEPHPVMTPAAAYQALIRGRTELVPVREAAGRVVAVTVVPEPPGVAIAWPGERMGATGSPTLRYLEALEAFDRTFPGFAHDVLGIEVADDRSWLLRVVVEDRRRRVALSSETSSRETAHETNQSNRRARDRTRGKKARAS